MRSKFQRQLSDDVALNHDLMSPVLPHADPTIKFPETHPNSRLVLQQGWMNGCKDGGGGNNFETLSCRIKFEAIVAFRAGLMLYHKLVETLHVWLGEFKTAVYLILIRRCHALSWMNYAAFRTSGQTKKYNMGQRQIETYEQSYIYKSLLQLFFH